MEERDFDPHSTRGECRRAPHSNPSNLEHCASARESSPSDTTFSRFACPLSWCVAHASTRAASTVMSTGFRRVLTLYPVTNTTN